MAIRYLVPEGNHLPISKEDGTPDHTLMGAAWAALHGGYRGNTYQGPDKDAALEKLRALYQSEGMDAPTAATEPVVQADETMGDVHVPAPLGPKKKPRFWAKMRELIAGSLAKGYMTADEFAHHQRYASAHAGGMARATKADERGSACSECWAGNPDDCLCAECNDPDNDGDCMCEAGMYRASESVPPAALDVALAALEDTTYATRAAMTDLQTAYGALAAPNPSIVYRATDNGVTYTVPASATVTLGSLSGVAFGDSTARLTPPLLVAAAEASPILSDRGEQFGVFLPCAFAEAPAWIPYLPIPGTFDHTKFGTIVITRERNADFVAKFNAGIYQVDSQGQSSVPLDAEHETKVSGALAWIKELRLNGDGSVDARVDWTDRGRGMLAEDRFKFVSPEFYDRWVDPLTNTPHTNVAIGGALTTRPYFKSNSQGQALRPLVASEHGYTVLDENLQPMPAWAGEETHAQAGQEEQSMSTAAVQLTEDQIKEFAELRVAASEAKALAEKNAAEAHAYRERVEALESASRRQAFAEQAGHWKFGTVADHVSFMEGLSEDQRAFYVTQQNALSAQLADSALFREIGKPGHDATVTATSQLDALAKARQKDSKGLTYHQAYAEILAENPEIYARTITE